MKPGQTYGEESAKELKKLILSGASMRHTGTETLWTHF